MMGPAVGQQDRLFYEFDLDDRVPADHLLRRIDAVLDLSWVRSELAPYYSHTGCPSIDPELMIRMLLVGYCYSIRSERRLCQDVSLNLAYRWFCRLGFSVTPRHEFVELGDLVLGDAAQRWCQANANQSPKRPTIPLSCRQLTPFGQRS